MNNIKSNFSIKDLENLSGIKAHTIRIWEKRYDLLSPNRTDTNIRTYDVNNLRKLLNVSFLNSNGYKISKIANATENEIPHMVKEIAEKNESSSHALSAFKLAMINFDQKLFYDTYEGLTKTHSFDDIFYNHIIPLLDAIGMLWQTDTITPANEHFMSSIIRQKILVKIEEEQAKLNFDGSEVMVLFLPSNEIHELGLMFLHYKLLTCRIQTLYLGQSVPMDSLVDMTNFYDNIIFVSYFTVMPKKGKVADYISSFNDRILTQGNHNLWLLGRKLAEVNLENLPTKVKAYKGIDSMVQTVKSLKANKN